MAVAQLMVLAMYSNFSSPLFWAVVIGWILSVTLHELGHGIAAYLGGDYTIRERGGLTLNPLQYVDPMMSIVLPVIFLIMGGIALPGGATYVRRDLIRSKAWNSIVSAAGPAMNFALFLLLAIPLHPRMGWINAGAPIHSWTTAQLFVASMAYLQLLSVLLNMVPVPGLDGFGIISPWLPDEIRLKLTTPPVPNIMFLAYFFLLWQIPQFTDGMLMTMFGVYRTIGIDLPSSYFAFRAAMFGQA